MSLTTMYPAKNNSPSTVLTADLSSSATTMTVDDPSVFPAAPNIAVLGNTDDAEIVLYTEIDGDDLTIVRGQNGTTPGTWGTGTAVARNFTAADHEAFRENILDLESRKIDGVAWGDITGTIGDQTDLATAFGTKQDSLTFDSAPTASSGNPVTSGGVKTALDLKTNLSQVAPEFSTSTVYAIDDLVIYQGALYRFSTTHPAGAWNSSHVIACTIAEVMSHFAKFRVSGTVSSGNMTLTDARIDSEHWRVPNDGIYLGTPSNVTSGINWSTNITQHTITLSATYSAATSVIVEFEWMQN